MTEPVFNSNVNFNFSLDRINSSKLDAVNTPKNSFDERHITMDEGEVKEIKRGEVATYPNVNSCFTVSAVLTDGSIVGAHLVSPANDQHEKKMREEKGVREPKEILPAMKEKIGNRTIKELVVIGSLHNSVLATAVKKKLDNAGNEVHESYSYQTSSWKTQDLTEQALGSDFDGVNNITTFISCYFEDNLEKYDKQAQTGFKAFNCVTDETALITIEVTEKNEVKTEIKSQKKYDEDPTKDSILHDAKINQMIADEDSFELWMGMKDYFGIFN